jgi:sugar phosphate isomerase/epimerase
MLGVSQFTTQPWSFEQDIEAYAELDIRNMELCEAKLDDARMAAQLVMPAASGISVTSVQPVVRTLFPSQSQPGPPHDPQERMARFRESITRIARSAPGAPFVTNTGIAPDGDFQRVWETAVREYRDLAAFAETHGVRVAFEPLNPTIVNVETTIWMLGQARRLIEAVDHPAFGLCLDVWNIWQSPDLDAEIARCGPYTSVVQISDWRRPRSFRDRWIPGQGEIPLPHLLRAIHDSGFRGAYAVEIFSEGVPGALWEADLRSVLRDCRTGLEHAWAAAFAGNGRVAS